MPEILRGGDLYRATGVEIPPGFKANAGGLYPTITLLPGGTYKWTLGMADFQSEDAARRDFEARFGSPPHPNVHGY